MKTHFAGFSRRFAANFIDATLLLPLLYFTGATEEIRPNTAIILIIQFFVPFLYCTVFWYFFAATPGKALLGIKIVPAKYRRRKPTYLTCVIRYFSYTISTTPIFLGLIWIMFDKKKQGWHDKIASTFVVVR